MNDIEFIQKITELKPKKTELNGLNYPEDFINTWLKGFDIVQKTYIKYEDVLLSLIKNNDISTLRINDISFDNELQEDEEFLFFGWDANNRLAINKTDGKIISYDSYTDNLVSYCAEDAEKFLDSLYVIMSFVKEKILKDYTEKERDRRSEEVAYIAALKAGGEQFQGYFRALLWLE